MNESNLDFIDIEGRRYGINLLAPLEALEWTTRFMTIQGTKDSTVLNGMLKDALARCYTPENEELKNQVVFNSWFRKHPEDMLTLGMQAAHRLAQDFLPKAPDTMMT